MFIRQFSRYRARVYGGSGSAAVAIGNAGQTQPTLGEACDALYKAKLVQMEKKLGLPTAQLPIQPTVLVLGAEGSGKRTFIQAMKSSKQVRFVEKDDENETALVLWFVDATNPTVTTDILLPQKQLFIVINKADLLCGKKQAILQVFARVTSQFGLKNPSRVLLTAFGSKQGEDGGDGDDWGTEFRSNEGQVYSAIDTLSELTALRSRTEQVKQIALQLLKEENARGWFQSRPIGAPGVEYQKLNIARKAYISPKQLTDIVRVIQEEIEPALLALGKRYAVQGVPMLTAKL